MAHAAEMTHGPQKAREETKITKCNCFSVFYNDKLIFCVFLAGLPPWPPPSTISDHPSPPPFLQPAVVQRMTLSSHYNHPQSQLGNMVANILDWYITN